MRKVSTRNIIFMFCNLTSDLGPCILFVFYTLLSLRQVLVVFLIFLHFIFSKVASCWRVVLRVFMLVEMKNWWRVQCRWGVGGDEKDFRWRLLFDVNTSWVEHSRLSQRWDGRIFFWMGIPEVKNQSEKQWKWGLNMFLDVHIWTVIYKKGTSPFFFRKLSSSTI